MLKSPRIVFMYLFCSNTAVIFIVLTLTVLYTTTTWRRVRDIALYR